jgi:hypothetical protein
VIVRTALSLRMTMGSNVRWKTSHSIATPSTAVDCGARSELRQHVQSGVELHMNLQG